MTSQYGACALHAGKARLHSRMLMHTPILRVRTRTYARTHRPVSNTCCFCTAAMIHERLAMLRFTYIACIVSFRFVGTFRSRTANGFGVCSWDSHMCVVKWVSNKAVVGLQCYRNDLAMQGGCFQHYVAWIWFHRYFWHVVYFLLITTTLGMCCQLSALFTHCTSDGLCTRRPRDRKYKVVQIWPGQTVTCLHTISPGHIWTTLYKKTGNVRIT